MIRSPIFSLFNSIVAVWLCYVVLYVRWSSVTLSSCSQPTQKYLCLKRCILHAQLFLRLQRVPHRKVECELLSHISGVYFCYWSLCYWHTALINNQWNYHYYYYYYYHHHDSHCHHHSSMSDFSIWLLGHVVHTLWTLLRCSETQSPCILDFIHRLRRLLQWALHKRQIPTVLKYLRASSAVTWIVGTKYYLLREQKEIILASN
jgi:hypothetical protein